MTHEEVRQRLRELTGGLSDLELESLVAELFSSRGGWSLSREDQAELDQRSEEMARGEGIAVVDIDRFVDELVSE